MAKSKTVFVCSNCGYESAKWLGKCPGCQEWNSFYEETLVSNSSSGLNKKKKMATPMPLNSVEGKSTERISTGLDELNRVLGGGLVKGSLI